MLKYMTSDSSLEQPEIKQNLVTTLNKRGYMLVKPEYFMQYFIDYAAKISEPVLDIGAAYGVATIAALKKGAHVVANDIEPRHLEILKSKVPNSLLDKLDLKPGNITRDLDFPESYFGAILASRIFSFIDPELLQHSFALIYKWLKPGGKFVYLGASPYMGTFAPFFSVYKARKKSNTPWPGYVDNIELYAPKHAHQLPGFIHLIDEDTLKKLLTDAGFNIEEMAYSPADEEHPEEMRLNNRTFLGAIAVKPSS